LHRFVSPSRDARHAKIDRRHGQHVYAAFQVPAGPSDAVNMSTNIGDLFGHH
jgi:hypothetical protein